MGFSENPKFFLLVKKILKKWKFIGISLSVAGFAYLCAFNKINKKADLDALIFSQFPGNSNLNKKDEEFLNNTSRYFSNYEFKEENIIDIINKYIKDISPFVETVKIRINENDEINNNVLISTVPCKFCNNMENLIVVINFDYKERKNFHSISVGLTLINYFVNCNYMSKDIVFLFTNKELLYSLGIQKFIEYFLYSNNVNNNRKYLSRSAIIIEFESIFPSHIHINYEGLNGLLPNLDFILLLTNELNYYNIPIKVESPHHVIFDTGLERNYEKGHIYFLRENIPAFTATGVSKIPLKNKMLNLFNFTKSMESFIRSQSNSPEGFCHSSNFYFFDTIRRRIPISIYCYGVYLICGYAILKLLKSSIFRNYINFVIGLYGYIKTVLIISLPFYLFSTNDKIYELLNLEKKLPLCEEWHPDHFKDYAKIANYWLDILILSIIVAFIFNYVISSIVKKFCKVKKYQKVKKFEKIVILDKIKNLHHKIKSIIGITPIYETIDTEKIITNSGDLSKLTKPKIVHSDDEDFLREKKNRILINALQEELDDAEKKLEFLGSANVVYIFNTSVAPYSSIMNQMNLFYFIFVVLLSSLYNWSYAALFSVLFVIPVSFLHNIKTKRKKIIQKVFILTFIILMLIYVYPYEGFILVTRNKITNQIVSNLAKCQKYLTKSKLKDSKYFPEILDFLCSNKIFQPLYLNKYYLSNKDIKFNYSHDIKNDVLINLYSIARNHYCIGSQVYSLICFTFFPIFFFIVYIFFC
ncbi:glycosylphosphatidylinositol anchor attachment 1 protein [Plasmodium gonderi]|uniref:Glycosylphosphatidylinositol anchor attachment 1 protein n=1 Tax=Plasmodium gonderi TaxID=77519 RepID=A0A1Y1JIV1_PLAGO|nr:glycosylphosphatidylinositol anchor attachment 1 protein [Plasmodium gonderi]GAW81568.1 glycosylphosphatidylinositol anchor attachment 1 protein [Plasmodium gonderi]